MPGSRSKLLLRACSSWPALSAASAAQRWRLLGTSTTSQLGASDAASSAATQQPVPASAPWGQPAASAAGALPLAVPAFSVWGANTNVGKTLVSVGLAHAAAALKVREAPRGGRMLGHCYCCWCCCGRWPPTAANTAAAPVCIVRKPPLSRLPPLPLPPLIPTHRHRHQHRHHRHHTSTHPRAGASRTAVGLPPPQVPLAYVKPVQTGFPADSDARLVVSVEPGHCVRVWGWVGGWDGVGCSLVGYGLQVCSKTRGAACPRPRYGTVPAIEIQSPLPGKQREGWRGAGYGRFGCDGMRGVLVSGHGRGRPVAQPPPRSQLASQLVCVLCQCRCQCQCRCRCQRQCRCQCRCQRQCPCQCRCECRCRCRRWRAAARRSRGSMRQ